MAGKTRKKLRKLRRKLAKTEKKLTKAAGLARKRARKLRKARAGPKTGAAAGPLVSPLAPAGGFPAMPPIAGVRFSSLAAEVRYRGRPDVMLAELAPGTAIAGSFTRSSTRAEPVLDCQQKIGGASEAGAAILVNSGNANAFTGAAGIEAVQALTAAVSARLDVPQARVFTASTGVIGEPLPHDRISARLDDLAAGLSPDGLPGAARAIMTTDTFPKGAAETLDIDGQPVTIAGFAKGSGMIAPDMATMLVFIFTDARIAQPDLQRAVDRLTPGTFNSITVDSDTSTSDTLLVAATGQSAEIGNGRTASGKLFAGALERVMRDLAHQVVRDGEGATKFVAVSITGAVSDDEARTIGLSVANSPLVKTAIAGEDPNWGRVVMAVGKSGAHADRDLLSIRFGDILVAEKGWIAPGYDEAAAAAYMRQAELEIGVDIGLGDGAATVWTCDLTKRYIEINADYRS